MIVVSDTTPLISLLKICKLDLLEKLFGEVLIPQAVFDELTIDARFQSEADQIKKEKFIIVKSVKNPESANILKRATGLDQGESEAIVLTDEMKADLLLMDEAKGRNVSSQMGIKIMGTIGIIMAAYEEKFLTSDEVKECVYGLQRAGRHIGQRHYQMLLNKLHRPAAFYRSFSSPVASLKALIRSSRSLACAWTVSQVPSVSYHRAFSSSTVLPCCSTQV